jgi:hypothetical protein
MTDSNKHSSLLQYGIVYGHKKFYNIGAWLYNEQVTTFWHSWQKIQWNLDLYRPLVEHLTHNPMVVGSNPATGTGRERAEPKKLNTLFKSL